MNDNPYSAPSEAAAGNEESKRRVPGYLAAFGAMSLVAEGVAAWFELPWDFIFGGLVVVGLIGLMMRGVFSAPVKPYTDDEPGSRPSEPVEPKPVMPIGEPNALFVVVCLLLTVLLAACYVATIEDRAERVYRGIVLGLAAVGATVGLAWEGSWRGMVAGGGVMVAAAEVLFRLLALAERAYG